MSCFEQLLAWVPTIDTCCCAPPGGPASIDKAETYIMEKIAIQCVALLGESTDTLTTIERANHNFHTGWQHLVVFLKIGAAHKAST